MFRIVKKTLKPGCRLCINVGDQFLSAKDHGRYRLKPIASDLVSRLTHELLFDYMGTIIWQKVTNYAPSGGGLVMGSWPWPGGGLVKIDFEYILLFRKKGKRQNPSQEVKELSKIDKKDWNQCFYGHWYFPGAKNSSKTAAFPLELPLRLIKMFSFVGETVLDPFVGTGTTLVAAKKLHRRAVGCELNEELRLTIGKNVGKFDTI